MTQLVSKAQAHGIMRLIHGLVFDFAQMQSNNWSWNHHDLALRNCDVYSTSIVKGKLAINIMNDDISRDNVHIVSAPSKINNCFKSVVVTVKYKGHIFSR